MDGKQVRQVIQKVEDAIVFALSADWTARQGKPNDYWASKPWSVIEQENRWSVAAKSEAVQSMVTFERAFTEGVIQKDDPRTYLGSQGAYWNSRRTVEPVTFPMELAHNRVHVDLGLTLCVEGKRVRVDGSTKDVYDEKNFPPVLRALAQDAAHDVLTRCWVQLEPFIRVDAQNFLTGYQEVVASIMKDADQLIEKHQKRLDKSRARAARPEVVAKREAEARTRARESLSALLTGPAAREILDEWSHDDLLGYLRLCQKHERILKELMTWSGRTPLGSKALCLEDVEVALDMAKVKTVMDS
jgi:hypothetical protein